MKAGKAISAVNICNEQTKETPIPCYGGNGLRGYVSHDNQNGNFCLIGRQGALCGNVCFATGKFYATEHAVVVKNNSSLNPRFLFHLLTNMNLNQYKSQGAQPGLAVGKLEEIKIPIPSLALQDRIANVLDNFDAICSDLSIGLPAEISLRKKQYEYYHDRLLAFTPPQVNNSLPTIRFEGEVKLFQYIFGYTTLRLGDIANLFRGDYITQKNSKKGDIPVILGGLEPAYYIDKPNHRGEIIVVSRSGASAGFVSQWNEPIFITDGFGFEAKREIISHKFLYYSLKNKEKSLNEMKRGAGVPHVSGEKLNNVVFPIPPLAEQERIVAILDKFDALVNDLSQGIPAEIEARKKQYEYYRDRLLSFKNAG